jgi:hypothetical protein
MAALEALSKLNENWINSIFQDAIKGHEVCRMLALSTISALVSQISQKGWNN